EPGTPATGSIAASRRSVSARSGDRATVPTMTAPTTTSVPSTPPQERRGRVASVMGPVSPSGLTLPVDRSSAQDPPADRRPLRGRVDERDPVQARQLRERHPPHVVGGAVD